MIPFLVLRPQQRWTTLTADGIAARTARS